MKDTEMIPEPEGSEDPPIILLGFEKKNYYMYKGEEHLNQLLLADGSYPKPVLCVHFESIIDAKLVIGPSFAVGSCWGIHPEIIARLRDTKTLIEKEA